jgi:hypothetical protein
MQVNNNATRESRTHLVEHQHLDAHAVKVWGLVEVLQQASWRADQNVGEWNVGLLPLKRSAWFWFGWWFD